MAHGTQLRAVLAHYGITHRARGGNQQVRCPFHDDTHASMSINLDNGLWRCFTCAVAGDAITFIETKENVKYGDARSILDGLVDGDSGTVRDESAEQSSSLLPGVKRHQPRRRSDVPTWLRGSTRHRTREL